MHEVVAHYAGGLLRVCPPFTFRTQVTNNLRYTDLDVAGAGCGSGGGGDILPHRPREDPAL